MARGRPAQRRLDVNILEAQIMKALDDAGVEHEVVDHEPVYTNPEMAERLGVDVSQTVKNLVLVTTEGRYVQVVLPGDKRFDAKKVARAAGAKKVSFAKPDKVEAMVGCKVGCVPPFGHRRPIPVFMDKELLDKGDVYFNPGVHSKSVRIDAARLRDLCKPTLI